jgi:poly [ADP-ribose] polymerase 10/14/15
MSMSLSARLMAGLCQLKADGVIAADAPPVTFFYANRSPVRLTQAHTMALLPPSPLHPRATSARARSSAYLGSTCVLSDLDEVVLATDLLFSYMEAAGAVALTVCAAPSRSNTVFGFHAFKVLADEAWAQAVQVFTELVQISAVLSKRRNSDAWFYKFLLHTCGLFERFVKPRQREFTFAEERRARADEVVLEALWDLTGAAGSAVFNEGVLPRALVASGAGGGVSSAVEFPSAVAASPAGAPPAAAAVPSSAAASAVPSSSAAASAVPSSSAAASPAGAPLAAVVDFATSATRACAVGVPARKTSKRRQQSSVASQRQATDAMKALTDIIAAGSHRLGRSDRAKPADSGLRANPAPGAATSGSSAGIFSDKATLARPGVHANAAPMPGSSGTGLSYKATPAPMPGSPGADLSYKAPAITDMVVDLTEEDEGSSSTFPREWCESNVPVTWTFEVGVDGPYKVAMKTVAEGTGEYTEVIDFFKQSFWSNDLRIVKLERIQNLELYEAYEAKRKSIFRREECKNRMQRARLERKWLFHGTDQAGADGIVRKGPDRNYNGKHATLFGKGVYFARDAYFSHKYTKTDADGCRLIFMCRVTVGVYTKGSSEMQAPPMRDEDRRYDSTVDIVQEPTKFVTFHDAQAYTDYLVRYKD